MQLENNFSTVGKNTGTPLKPLNPKLWKYLLLAPIGQDSITKANRADDATFKTFLNSKLRHDTPALRWQLFGRIEGVDDKTEAGSVQTLPNGTPVYTDRSHPAYEFQFLDGGFHSHVARLSYNNLNEYYVAYYIDGDGCFWGCQDETTSTTMRGYDLSICAEMDYKPATRTTVAEYKWMMGFADAAQLNDNVLAHKTSLNPKKLSTMQDVVMVDVTSDKGVTTNGVHVIEFWAGGKTLNLATYLGSALATSSNFIFRNSTTKNAVTKTVALGYDNTAIVVTADTADTDYVNAANHDFYMAANSVLDGNGCGGYETPTQLTLVGVDV